MAIYFMQNRTYFFRQQNLGQLYRMLIPRLDTAKPWNQFWDANLKVTSFEERNLDKKLEE